MDLIVRNLLIATGDDTRIVGGAGDNRLYLTGEPDRVTLVGLVANHQIVG